MNCVFSNIAADIDIMYSPFDIDDNNYWVFINGDLKGKGKTIDAALLKAGILVRVDRQRGNENE